jgi:hypothetical protein
MIYSGKSADGSDIYPVQGMFMSEDGKSWSNQPLTHEQYLEDREWKLQKRIYLEIYDYCHDRRLTFRDAYNQIATKTSGLSARCKQYLKNFIENE